MSAESYQDALARSIVLRPSQALTEQEIAARIVEGRERMKAHDRVFASDYLSIGEERIISRALAKKLGHPDQYEGGDE